jgi:hypothetical protein
MKRNLGKLNTAVLDMIPKLKAGNKIGVLGCKDPEDIIQRLKNYGVDVQTEPMTVKQPMKAIYNLSSIEGEIIGFKDGDTVQTGFIFYIN